MTFISVRVYGASMSVVGDKHQDLSRVLAIPPPVSRAVVKSSRARRLWLALLVHRDAFHLDPLGYIQALVWRLRGLRIRSRNRLAALMGRSSHAYALWMARVEPGAQAASLRDLPAEFALILPIVDCTSRPELAERTSRSLIGAGVDPRLIWSIDCTGVPADLMGRLDPKGTWMCIMRAGDELAANAFDIYARAAAKWSGSWVIYADDDLLEEGVRRVPHFKASWNPDLYKHHDFVTCSAIVRATPDMVGNLEGADWAKQLTDRAIARGLPVHVPVILHHRLDRPKACVPQKPRELTSGSSPFVSVIVPTRNHLPLLRTCIEGVRRTAYSHIQLIVVDNDSDDEGTLDYLQSLRREGATVVHVGGPFNFSALNNSAVKHAEGELLCFLNNDVEIIDPDWLSLLVRQAIRPELGAVGGRLLYPDGSVQHAGVVIGVGGGAAHAHRFQTEAGSGYFFRDRLPQQVSAVTAACLVVSKDKFCAVGGFDEEDFPVAFNDVDLCLRLNSNGWQSFYEPRAVLIHHESKSRGSDNEEGNRDRFAAELAALKRRWATDRALDPYHHPQLSRFCEQFNIAV